MNNVTRVLAAAALIVCGVSGCSKEQSVSPKMWSLEEGGGMMPRPRLPQFVPLSQCINDYDDFVTRFNGTTINIVAVILQDGTRIDVGGPITSMVYRAELSNESLSIFRSIFDVAHLVSGNIHHVWWNVWSRGCYLQRPDDPNYTNLLKGAEVITINSSFKWGIAPYQNMPISLLVIE